jgi:hypothetical protein
MGVRTARHEGARSALIFAGAGVLAIVGIALWAVVGSRTPPVGPVPVAWDRQPCAHCAMHLGEPAFAVQLHTADGDVLFFDDPGCYFTYLAEHGTAVHAVWFHELREDRWLPESDIAFLPIATSPMGWGLGAVKAGTAGALSVHAARALVLADRRGDGGRRERPAR